MEGGVPGGVDDGLCVLAYGCVDGDLHAPHKAYTNGALEYSEGALLT
jgi:hypothetical protein